MRNVLVLALVLTGCAHAPTSSNNTSSSTEAIVNAPDRSEADKKLDAGRKPAQFLQFLKAEPGMKVAELSAGGGYTTELLARAVAPNGVVYGQNTKWALEKFAEKPWSERLSKPVNKNVIRVDRELDDPFPPEAKDLDLVVSNAIYHDTVWLNVDRAKMNSAVFAALKSGGRYAICDSSAKEGSGTQDVQTLHRIDEQVVKNEVTAAGFQLAEESNILRNPADTRDWSASPGAAGEKRGTSDRFCLAFKKP
ncbi:MAG: class I SAM-dependent methyltransferase [Myxococcaceae bacterium]